MSSGVGKGIAILGVWITAAILGIHITDKLFWILLTALIVTLIIWGSD